MGYAIMPELKEPTVCNSPCEHRDCTYWREFVATAVCDICKEPIVSGDAYYQDVKDKPTHAVCTQDLAEKERAEVK